MLGMFLTADSPTVLVQDGSFVSTGSALAVTVVDSATAWSFISSSTCDTLPRVTSTLCLAATPGACAVIVYERAGIVLNKNSPSTLL
jgi:hypothetical protein